MAGEHTWCRLLGRLSKQTPSCRWRRWSAKAESWFRSSSGGRRAESWLRGRGRTEERLGSRGTWRIERR